jgi:dinuclear metal center YbgI/SA1388 family protein
MLLEKLISQFDSLWPPADKEEWDKPGLMLGSLTQDVKRVLLSVDVTRDVTEEAISTGCQLIVSHHPMFMRGVFELSETGIKGAKAALAIRHGVAVFSAHTNADFQTGGVTQSLATKLGLTKLTALESTSSHVVMGEVDEVSLLDFARLVGKKLPAVAQGVKVAGDPSRMISKVAVLAGSGDGYLPMVAQSSADLYITSDLRHHPAQDFSEQSAITGGPALMDIAHWAAEWVWLDSAKAQLENLIPQVEFVVSEINTDPWTFAVMQ